MQRAFVIVALFAIAQSVEAENPLGKVIELLDGLAAKVVADGEREAKAYHDYFEWCDDASKNTENDITTASRKKAKLEAKIAEASSSAEDSTSAIEELGAAVAKADAELKDATQVREKEAVEFAKADKELAGVVDTLDRAIGILEREMQKNPAALAQLDGKSMTSLVQTLGVVVDAAAFSAADQKTLLALVQSQEDAEDGMDDAGAPAASVYKSQSSGIFDLLEDLKDKAQAELAQLRKDEKTSAHNFEMLRQSLEDKGAADNKDLAEEKVAVAAAEETKAGAEGELAVTTKELKAAQGKLVDLRATCMTVAADHEKSVTSRAGELKVIAEAKKILVETSGGAVEQTYSFVQMAQSRQESAKIVGLVKRLATQHHSAALAQLASRIVAVVRYGADSKDVFAKVKGLIGDMIAKLKKEAEEEATEKAYCDEEMAKTEAKKEELEDDVSKLTAKIDQAASSSATLKGEVKQLQKELGALAREQADINKIREESHAVYVEAKADLEQGLDGVRKALTVLRDYYASDDEDAGAAMLQQPEPPTPENHGKAGGAAGSIIGILEVVESDFATNLEKVETEEADEASAYEKTTQDNKVTRATQEGDVTGKTQEFNALDKTISDLSSDRDTEDAELAAVNEYYRKLQERCVAKPESYEERKKRRDAEIAGLKEALSILEGETAFVQRKRNVRGSLGAR